MHSRMMNMPCQPMMSVKNPPATGAATGAIPLMAPIIAIAFASSRPENLSAATDREITMPPDAPMPCRSRNATNQCIVGESIQPMVERINTAIETSSSGRRPYLSLNGPNRSCPAARPIILNVKPSCTIGIEVWKLSVIAGNAGRYMSVTNGPNAVSEPRSK